MKDGFIKVAAATPSIRVADTKFNAENIIACIKEAADAGAKLIVMPELCVTACTCGDLFFQSGLIRRAEKALLEIAEKTKKSDIISVVGVPVQKGGKLYNCAAFIKDGKILGLVPSVRSDRWFNTKIDNSTVKIGDEFVAMGTNLIFEAYEVDGFSIAAEIGEDLYSAAAPSAMHTSNGARIIVNPAASNEMAGRGEWDRDCVKVQSAKTLSAYIRTNAAEGESTTDLVFSGRKFVFELGKKLAETEAFSKKIVYTDIDVEKIGQERKKNPIFKECENKDYIKIGFHTTKVQTELLREFDRTPFVPCDKDSLKQRCKEVFAMQYKALEKRLSHIGAKTVTIGVSGGLDSTLALLVIAKAFEELNLPAKDIIAVTMPCFGTGGRTYNNAKSLMEHLDVTLREINIGDAVTLHLRDIGADINCHDVTYENAQARERTQILMDIANKTGGIVIGTGDLSELALGFATYNGDHMSMYGVNASVPKTLMRSMVRYIADTMDGEIKSVLYDIVDTPVSPELLPPSENGEISQATEEIVGPYELHDFFLYNMVRWGFSREKISRMATAAFKGKYDDKTIKKWLDIFMKRFFANQFKRSCLPDGVKVGSVGLSPRGDFQMPSDATEF